MCEAEHVGILQMTKKLGLKAKALGFFFLEAMGSHCGVFLKQRIGMIKSAFHKDPSGSRVNMLLR